VTKLVTSNVCILQVQEYRGDHDAHRNTVKYEQPPVERYTDVEGLRNAVLRCVMAILPYFVTCDIFIAPVHTASKLQRKRIKLFEKKKKNEKESPFFAAQR